MSAADEKERVYFIIILKYRIYLYNEEMDTILSFYPRKVL